jgi:hypothetical protein
LETELPLWPAILYLDPKIKFQTLLAQQGTIGLLAKFGHDVVSIFESIPMYIPPMAQSD